jgi:LPXTG-motif cell wall-anchored protein
MKRDTVKTLAGLIVIAIIVVATFMYGNAQRQSQLKHDQDVKNQQQAKVAAQTSKAQPATSPQTGGQQASNTAPVKSPASSSLQGSAPASKSPAATTAPKPSGSPSGQVAGAQTPQTGGTDTNDPLPQTGSPLSGVVGAAAVLGAAIAFARSKRAVYEAARGQR